MCVCGGGGGGGPGEVGKMDTFYAVIISIKDIYIYTVCLSIIINWSAFDVALMFFSHLFLN